MAIAMLNQAGPHAATNLVQAITINPAGIEPAGIVPGTPGPLLSRVTSTGRGTLCQL
jgi:hypothetical protein